MKSFHSAILPSLEPLLAFIVPLLDKNRSPAERRIAICVFDDIFEHASDGGGALKYLDGFVSPCIAGCTDNDADVRQASVYGVGVMSEHCGQSFNAHVPSALSALDQLPKLIIQTSRQTGGRLLAISLLEAAPGVFNVDRIAVVSKWAI